MATKFVEYVDTIQPQNDSLQVTALAVKCSAAQNMGYDAKAMKIAKETLTVIEEKKKLYDNADYIPQPFGPVETWANHNSSDLHSLCFYVEASANHCVGHCLMNMKTENSAKPAVPLFERAKYMYESHGDAVIAADIDEQIKHAKSMYGENIGGDKNIESELKATRNKYDSFASKLGEHSPLQFRLVSILH